MRPVTRAIIPSEIPGVSNGYAAQMGAHPQHDQPIGLLHPLVIMLWVPQAPHIDALLRRNLLWSPMPDEQRFTYNSTVTPRVATRTLNTSPLESNRLPFRNISQLDLDLSQRQHVSGGAHRSHELRNHGFCGVRGGHGPRPRD